MDMIQLSTSIKSTFIREGCGNDAGDPNIRRSGREKDQAHRAFLDTIK